MPPDVLERFVDDVENASRSERGNESEDGTGSLLSARAPAGFEPFAALRTRIAEDGDAFAAWAPVYKHLRAHPAQLAEVVRRVRAARAAHRGRALAYRAARDTALRDWALEQLDVETRSPLGSGDASREALRRHARSRVEVYLRAEAELRFRALAVLAAVLAAVSAAVDPERAAARRVLTGRAADDAAIALGDPGTARRACRGVRRLARRRRCRS